MENRIKKEAKNRVDGRVEDVFIEIEHEGEKPFAWDEVSVYL